MVTELAIYFIMGNMFLLLCLLVICLHLLSAVHELRRRIAEDPFCRILKTDAVDHPPELPPVPKDYLTNNDKSLYRDRDGKYSRKAYYENKKRIAKQTGLEDDLQWAREDTAEGKRSD